MQFEWAKHCSWRFGGHLFFKCAFTERHLRIYWRTQTRAMKHAFDFSRETNCMRNINVPHCQSPQLNTSLRKPHGIFVQNRKS